MSSVARLSLLDDLRAAAGRALRARVAGDDAAIAAQRIWGAEGPRWFTADDPVWRVHADASMFTGGVAALLLQSLHPGAMAGVAGHSGYKSDPWGRLQRTSRFIATTTFGTVSDAEAAIAAVRAVHERVRGRDDRGVPYRASDPHLLGWVHAAEAHCFLTAYQRFGAASLSVTDADTYVAQSAVVAERLGAVAPPRSVAELRTAMQGYRSELRTSAKAREAARFLLLEPPLPWSAKPGYAAIAAGGLSLLPGWARSELGLPTLIGATTLGRAAGHLATAAIRWAMTDDSERRRGPG